MTSAVPIHKRGDKQNIKKFINLFHFFQFSEKTFERLISKQMHSFFIENGLISPNQSGFKQGNSCIN